MSLSGLTPPPTRELPQTSVAFAAVALVFDVSDGSDERQYSFVFFFLSTSCFAPVSFRR